MKRITLVLGVVALMVAMLMALAAPAMAKDNGNNKDNGNKANTANNNRDHNNGINRFDNRIDNQLNRLDNRLDNRVGFDDENFLVSDVNFTPVFTTNEGLADELCSPLSSDAVNNSIPGCIFGNRNDNLNTSFVSDIDTVGFDDVNFVDVDRDIHNGNAHHNGNGNDNNHNGNGNHNGGSGQKGNGK